MKKKAIIFLVIFGGILGLFIYVQALDMPYLPRPENMGGQEASIFSPDDGRLITDQSKAQIAQDRENFSYRFTGAVAELDVQ